MTNELEVQLVKSLLTINFLNNHMVAGVDSDDGISLFIIRPKRKAGFQDLPRAEYYKKFSSEKSILISRCEDSESKKEESEGVNPLAMVGLASEMMSCMFMVFDENNRSDGSKNTLKLL